MGRCTLRVVALVGVLGIAACMRAAVESGVYPCKDDGECLWGWRCRSVGGAAGGKTCQVGPGVEPTVDLGQEIDRPRAIPDIAIDRSYPDRPAACPAPTTSSGLCLRGLVVQGQAYLAFGGAAAVTGADITLKVFDATMLAGNPAALPLGTTGVDPNGYFTLTDLPTATAMETLLVEVDDGPKDKFARTGTTIGVSPSAKNLEGLIIPILEQSVFAGLELAKEGNLLVQFRRLKGSGVPHLVPTKDGALPPWPAVVVRYFSDDFSTPPFWVPGAKETSASGLVALQGAPLALYGGLGQGCSIETGLGFSVPGLVSLIFLKVDGC